MISRVKTLPWAGVALVLLLIALLVPGLALVFAPTFLSATGALHTIAIILPAQAVGAALLGSGLLTLHPKTREFGYLGGFILYTILFVCAMVAFVAGPVHSILIFALPLVPLAFAEATRDAIRRNHGQ